MDEPIVCRACDRFFDPALTHCPFCGAARLPDESFEDIVDDSFERMERSHGGTTLRRLDELIARLEEMERDLSIFLEQDNALTSSRIDC